MKTTCPICNKLTSDRYAPFCSKHCADIDLGRWFKDIYVIPTQERAEDLSRQDSADTDTRPDED